MDFAGMSRETFKELIREAILETFDQRRDLFREVLKEAMEDYALSAAIDEGRGEENVSRDRILDVLDTSE